MSIILGAMFTLCPAALSGGPGVYDHPINGVPITTDQEDGGAYALAGTVGIDATPDVLGAYRVSLICKRSKRIVRQQWSGSDGVYRFAYIRPGPWIVLAEDHTLTYNAVVADNKTAEAM